MADDFSGVQRRLESEGFDGATAERKQEILWKLVSEQPYEELPPVKFSFLTSVYNTTYLPKLRKAFTTTADVRPPRTKAFHPYGTVAQIEWIPEGDHRYTGIFQTGGLGLARLSLAMSDGLYAPSAAIKIFIDGKHPSENLVLDQSLDKQTSRDFFERAPTNHTLWPKLMPMRLIWFAVDRWLGQIAPALYQSLDHLASVTSDGQPVAEPRAPHTVFLYAPAEVRMRPDVTKDFRVLLGEIPPGTVLYRVFGIDSQDSEQQVPVGSIKTRSHFVASHFGDRVLSLRHAPNPGSPITRNV